MSANLSERDYELLSAYIDGELPDADRLALEIRLDAEPELRRELEALRQTVALVNQLPKLKAPRDFTLAVAQPRPAPRLPLLLTGTFSALSAAAAVLLLLFGGYLLFAQMGSTRLPTAGFIAAVPTPTVPLEVTLQSTETTLPQTAAAAATTTTDAFETESLAAVAPESTDADALNEQASDAAGQGQDELAQRAPESAASPAIEFAVPAQSPDSPMLFADETQEAQEETGTGLTTLQSAAATATPALTATPEARTIPLEPPVRVDSSVVGLVAVTAGVLLLVVALVTTLARRRRVRA